MYEGDKQGRHTTAMEEEVGERISRLVQDLRQEGGALCARHLAEAVGHSSSCTEVAVLEASSETGKAVGEASLRRRELGRAVANWDKDEVAWASGFSAAALAGLEVARELAWEALHTGPWREVPVVWRDAFALTGLLLARHQHASCQLLAALRTLDVALLTGGPLFRPELDAAVAELEEQRRRGGEGGQGTGAGTHERGRGGGMPPTRESGGGEAGHEEGTAGQAGLDGVLGSFSCGPAAQPSGGRRAGAEDQGGRKRSRRNAAEWHWKPERPLQLAAGPPLPPGALCSLRFPRKHLPSLEDFLCSVVLPAVPTIVTGAMAAWPAMDRWHDLSYLRRVAGARTVPVEVGEHYLSQGWHQELMSLADFIDLHLAVGPAGAPGRAPGDPGRGEASSAMAYLAQHPLFEQIPELQRDICIPEYCALGSLQATNAWLGPAGTLTPLHHDPHHNLLAQVVGRKYLRVYAAEAAEGLYPHPERMLRNSSQVDLDHPKPDQFPKFVGLPYWDGILEEGEMLYIPPGWWHYVRALTGSFSVSFWWSMPSG